MAALVWDRSQPVRYESGVDRGVFFPEKGPGVVWNGLVSVQEEFVGGDMSSHHYDGVKYMDLVSPKNFRANITAFSAPAEFASANGERTILPGFVLTRQPRTRFGMSYRTRIGSGSGYKIHLIYNAVAVPSKRGYSTIQERAEAVPLEWEVDATPPRSLNYRPTAHFVIDSTKTNQNILLAVEAILYGTDERQSRLPPMDEIIDLVIFWEPTVIVPRTTGLHLLGPGMGDLSKTRTPGVYRDLPTTRLARTATDGLYRLENTA